ncbi:MAG: molecular chaperone TorD family protein [Deltaproteobacteria bacterium]|nr:MAG: molecular chaperone TorD family protein [Deltaproteobacteria bacterium]
MTPEQTILLDGLEMMGQIFWGPSLEACTEMVRETYLDRLQYLKSILLDRSLDSLDQIVSMIKSFPDGDSLYQHLEKCYVRLFITAKGGIVAPLYESCYEFEGAPLMGRAATEMKERFEAQGLSVADNIREPPDHISIELEYLYLLLDKGWDEQDDALVAEGSTFAKEIMLQWVAKLHERLASETQCLFYPLMVSILEDILLTIGES